MSACCPTCGHGTSGCLLTTEQWRRVRELLRTQCELARNANDALSRVFGSDDDDELAQAIREIDDILRLLPDKENT